MSFTIDASGLDELAADLTNAGLRAQLAVPAIVERGALNVKGDAQRLASGLGHAPLYPQSITYDMLPAAGGTIAAEIGPDKDKPQGALGNLLEYGSVNNVPFAHLGPALDIEAPKFVTALTTVAGELLR